MASGAYAALTVLITWPLGAHPSSAFPHDAFDPALNAWILWWNAHAVPLTARWWNPPSFWPIAGALSFSEHLLGITVVSTPLLRLGLGPVATYNLVLLISYPLTALAAHALVFAIARRHGPATIAGLILGFSPYRVAQLPHVQMLWAFGMPLALLVAHRYLERGARWLLPMFGAAWLVVALSNSYYMVFFPVLLVGWILWFGRGAPRRAAAIVATWVVASLPLVPILRSYAEIHRTLGLSRRFDEIESFGADLTAIFTTAPEMIVWNRLSAAGRGEGQLFPGAVALALVVAGVVVALFGRRARAATASGYVGIIRLALKGLTIAGAAIAISPLLAGPWQFSLAGRQMISVSSAEKPLSVVMVLLVAVLVTSSTFADMWRRQSVPAFYTLAAAALMGFSWGPHPKFAGIPVLFRGPYTLLLQLPGLSAVRVPARFGMLVVLCLSVAAALAFAELTTTLAPRLQRLCAILCSAVVIAESWPAISFVPPALPISAIQGRDLNVPIVELPLGESWLDAPAQFRGITHGHPVVNGYSGYAPPHYRLLTIALRLNDGDVLRGLTTTTPLVVALNRHEEIDRWRSLVESQHGERMAEDSQFEIYRLPVDPRPAAHAVDPPLPIRSIDASAGREGVARMLDGNLDTIWNSQRVQAGGEYVIVDLGRDRHVSAIRLTSGAFVGDYPRRLAVDCAADGVEDWSPCWSGSISGLLLRSLLDDAPHAAASIPIDRDHVRRLRLTQTAIDALNGWSIAELAALGR